MMGQENAQLSPDKRPISCDQVAWLNDALYRHADAVRNPYPSISRAREAGRLAALLEIMAVLDLEFADSAARENAVAGFRELHSPTEMPRSEQINCGVEFTESGLYRNCHRPRGHEGDHKS